MNIKKFLIITSAIAGGIWVGIANAEVQNIVVPGMPKIVHIF